MTLSTFPNTYHPADFPLFYGLELGHMATVKARILKNKKQVATINLDQTSHLSWDLTTFSPCSHPPSRVLLVRKKGKWKLGQQLTLFFPVSIIILSLS